MEAKGYEFKKIRENRGKRPGTRYILQPKNVERGTGSRDNSHRGTYAPTDCLDASPSLGALGSPAIPLPIAGPPASGLESAQQLELL